MDIYKYGHCCMVIQEGDLRMMTDPGGPEWVGDDAERADRIDMVFITHEHSDHLHIVTVKRLKEKNPSLRIITNRGVGTLLEKEGIAYEVVEEGDRCTEKGVLIEAWGSEHAPIHPEVPAVINTGYCFGERFFFPGDAFTKPPRPVEVLALPIAAPWLKISESLAYAEAVRPRLCFPVHDGMLRVREAEYHIPQEILKRKGITYHPLSENETITF